MPSKYVRVKDRVAAIAAGTDPRLSEVLDERTRKNEETMQRIVAAFGSSDSVDRWEIRVYRVFGNNRERFGESYLFTISPDELPIYDRLRDVHGSGRYRGRAYKNGVLENSFEIDIEAVNEPPRNVPAPAETPAISKPGEALTLLQALEQSNMRMMEFFERRLAQLAPPQPPPDPMAAMTQLATLMTTMKSLMPEPPAQNLDILLKGMELAKDFGGGGGDTGFLDIVKELVRSPLVENALTNAAASRGLVQPSAVPAIAPPAVRPILPANATPVMPTSGPNHQAMGQNDVNEFVAAQLNTLVMLAGARSDPALIAETVYDNLPDATLDYIVSSENIIAELAAIDPRVNQHVVWFQHLLTAVKRIDAEEQGNAEAVGPADRNIPDSGGVAGNGADARGDAGDHPPVQSQPDHKGAVRKAGAKATA
jgi:hypothetical protein